MGLGKLAKAIKVENKKADETLEGSLLKVIDSFFRAPAKDKGMEERVSRLAFRPSSIHKCARELYYFLSGEKEVEKVNPRSQRILEVGTALHEWIQEDVFMVMGKLAKFPVELLEDKDMYSYGMEGITYVKEHSAPPMEIKFVDTRWTEKFPISAMVDGALRFGGEDMLFEFKTINTKDFGILIEPKREHRIQGAVYALSTGIRKVLFVYLDKNTQDLKLYLVEYTQIQLDYIINRVQSIEECVVNKQVPDMESKGTNCIWCKYKHLCGKEWVDDEDGDILPEE